MDSKEVTIDGQKFRFVKLSRRGEVAVYNSGELYARAGELNVIARMAALHKKFDEFGFPVPKIVGRGEISGGAYYLEESLGEKCFSELFREDMEKHGAISPELFEQFLKITEKFTRAQLRSAASDSRGVSITELVGPKDLAEELPEYGEKILMLYDEALEAVGDFPLVLTHGDFCSHNLFPDGIIDFEKAYCAPVGYDIVTNIFQNKYFPESREYEYYRFYVLPEDFTRLYYRRLDALYREHGLPEISKYKAPFEYMRAVWQTARNHRAPKLQKWRYELFKKQYLL